MVIQINPATIAIIGGSGLYEMEGLTDVESVDIDTPFGRPSDAITLGTLEGARVAFLPRHGQGHRWEFMLFAIAGLLAFPNFYMTIIAERATDDSPNGYRMFLNS